MNTLNKIFTAAATAAVLLSANSAFAADAGLTRQQVIAELAQARADGSIDALNTDNNDRFLAAPKAAKTVKAAAAAPVAVQGAKTRAQVIAELRASQADGTLALSHSELVGDHLRLAEIQNKKAAAAAVLAE